jgi:hypothetical protein
MLSSSCGPPAGWAAALGGEAGELLQVLAGAEATSADFDVGQVASAPLVIEQVAGRSGEPGDLIDGVGQPLGVRLQLKLASCRNRSAPPCADRSSRVEGLA